MIESHLVGGRQDLVAGRPLTYGQSITDACVDWETSASMLAELAAAVRLRRAKPIVEQGAAGLCQTKFTGG
jgi:3-deoxy-7-phosphoheptulonate synthase